MDYENDFYEKEKKILLERYGIFAKDGRTYYKTKKTAEVRRRWNQKVVYDEKEKAYRIERIS